jgi:hypothetical protein
MAREKFFDSKEEMIALTAQMKMLGVTLADISFQGGGDSGEIYSIDLYKGLMHNESIEMPTDMVSWTKQVYGDQVKTQKDISIGDVLDDIGYRVLDATGMDWYNNEGGQGTVHIYFDEELPRIEVNMEINVTHTEDHDITFDPYDDEASFYEMEGK